MTDSLILKPEEVQRRRATTQQNKQEQEEQVQIQNFAGAVKIEFESMGRFDTPPVLYFKDYTNKDVNDIILSNPNDLLFTIISILNKNKVNEENFNVENMTPEDLIETLIAIKIQFESPFHTLRWICECQREKEEQDRQINSIDLNLIDLNYKSIEQVEQEMKDYFKEVFSNMTDTQFTDYLYKKYKNNPLDDIESHTREKEIDSIKVKEPFTILNNDDTYTIRYPRMKDLLEAVRYAEKIYSPKIKNIQNRKEANIPLSEVKAKKEEELQKLKEEQGRLIILYSKSLLLQTKNGVTLSTKEKFEEYSNIMPRTVNTYIDKIFEQLQFGLQHEMELCCPMCGNSTKRLLQQGIDPRELLPYGDNNKPNTVSTNGESRVNTGLNIYFGV
jgi:hypothetical protein